MEKIHLNLSKVTDDSYDIFLESGLFGKIPKDLKHSPIGNRYAVITDSNVKGLYGKKLVDGLKDEGLTAYLLDFPASEESKNLKTVEYLVKKLVDEGLDRRSAILALGGGIVGDVAGFVAAIYMRGISYVQIPTSLLAQVDSSIGGKTAVDLREGKNLIGSFYQPERVYMDPTVLSTLPERELKNGLVEIIKYGVIYDSELFEYLEDNVKEINELDMKRLTKIILKSCQIKAEIVQKDEMEVNLRSILNYGHTLGHAIEKCGEYKGRLHGEAVSIGMNFAGNLAVKMVFWRREDLERQNKLLESFGLPLRSEFKPRELFDAMYHDKKAEGGEIMFVLPERIGEMASIDGKYRIPVAEEELMSALSGFS